MIKIKFILFLSVLIINQINLFSSEENSIKYMFIENNGDLPGCIQYYAKTDNLNIYVDFGAIVLEQVKNKNKTIINRIRIDFPSLQNFEPIASNFRNTKIYSFRNNKIKQLSGFKSLRINEIYEGVSLHLFFSEQKFRFEFEVKPFADAEKIKLKINGHEEIKTGKKDLTLKTALGKIFLNDLNVFNGIENIESYFELENNTISFNIPDYNSSKPLLIDPVIFSSYIGGNRYDISKTIDIAENGDIYIAGQTSSNNFPVTDSAYSRSFHETDENYPDAFVSCFDQSGELKFSTYIGGFGDDYAEDIVVQNNIIYLTGYTNPLSKTFPVTDSSFQTQGGGGYDAFLLKLSANGTKLISSTLFGSVSDDFAQKLSLTENGNIAVTGYSGRDGTFIFTEDAVQNENKGGYDIFLSIFNSELDELKYSTLIGGEKDDFGSSVNYANGFKISGITYSDDLPVTPNAFQKELNGGQNNLKSDAFLMQLNKTSYQIEHLTYFGGAAEDKAYASEVSADSSVYVCGYTESVNMPVFDDSFDKEYNKDFPLSTYSDVFAVKFSKDLKKIKKFTYLGADGTERAFDMKLTQQSLFLTGSVTSKAFPVTGRVFDRDFNSVDNSPDAYIAEFDHNLKYLKYATYVGGEKNDIAYGIDFYNGKAVITGRTQSADLPTFNTEMDSIGSGSYSDAFVFSEEIDRLEIISEDTVVICSGQLNLIEFTVPDKTGGMIITVDPMNKVEIINGKIYSNLETLTDIMIIVEDETGAKGYKNITLKPHDFRFERIEGETIVSLDSSYIYHVPLQNTADYEWNINGGTIEDTVSPAELSVVWTDNSLKRISVNAYDEYCEYNDTLYVTSIYNGNISLIYFGDSVICSNESVTLDAGPGFLQYYWNNGERSRIIEVSDTGKYYCDVIDSSGRGFSSDTVEIKRVIDSPSAEIEGHLFADIDTVSTFSEISSNSVVFWLLDGEKIENSEDTKTINYRFDSTGLHQICVIVENIEGCRDTACMDVYAGSFKDPVISFPYGDKLCIGDSLIADAGYGYRNYRWSSGDTTRFISIESAGDYFVKVIDHRNNIRFSDTVTVKAYPKPKKPNLSYNGDYLRCLTYADRYEWYRDEEIILGKEERNIKPPRDGSYRVKVYNQFECGTFSDPVIVDDVSVSEDQKNSLITIRDGKIIINKRISQNTTFRIYNYLGELIYEKNLLKNYYSFDHGLNKGVYFVLISSSDQVNVKKIMVK